MDIPAATAAELSAAYAAGSTSPEEVVRALIDRIAAVDGQVNAMLIVSPTALADAAECGRRLRAGLGRSALEGIPVLLKDNLDTADLPTTAGSRLLLDSRPVRDATLVTRLREAGAIVLGKTNLTEWSNFRSTGSISGWSGVGGQTRNPHVLDRNTSGSSAGSGAAVAAGYAPLAIGTETDGSILSPAAHCGIVGFKPTVGLVPGAGIVPISSAQDTAGPMTRSVADAIALLAVIATTPVVVPELPADPLLAWFRPTPVAEAEPAAGGALVLAAFDEHLQTLAAAGVRLVEIDGPPAMEISDAERPMLLSEFRRDLTAYLAGRPGAPADIEALIAANEADPIELSIFGQEQFHSALTAVDADSAEGLAGRERATGLALDWLRSVLAPAATAPAVGVGDGVGAGERPLAILAPTCGPTRPIGHDNELGAFSTYSTAAVAGAPSVTVPAGAVGAAGVLPIGVALMGLPGADGQLLALAALLESTIGRLLPPRFLPTLVD